MTSRLLALSVAAADPARLADFWTALLSWSPDPSVAADRAAVTLRPADDTGLRLRFRPSPEPKTAQNPIHLDLTSTSFEDQQQTVQRALGLGAQPVDVGQRPEEDHVVLADPEGNEFCVIEPGNRFLADCGFVGAVACDGSREVGLFWSRALGWPLVWDQDEETGIRAPGGGPKITWGGPSLLPSSLSGRVHLALAPPAGVGRQAELDHLVSLGARRRDAGPARDPGTTVLTDPDGRPITGLDPGWGAVAGA